MAAPGFRNPPPAFQVAIFLGATFASAFLIFLVQPLVGKRILPWFGGSPGVWMLCLAFYQCALFLGYAYAHALIRIANPKNQAVIHAALLGLALAALPVLPEDSWRSVGGDPPQLRILQILVWNVALPFAILAASSPLIQAWFARRNPTLSPYPLYAVSNLGSLVALAAYPFWLEPRLPATVTGTLWSLGFVLAGILIVTCALLARSSVNCRPDVMPRERAAPRQIAFWACLSGTAVAILMGVTNRLTLDVASLPFLWVLPLGLYLVTFIAAFASERLYIRPLFVTFVGTIVVALQFWWIFYELYQQILLYCGLLLGSCMILHAELYRKRPPPESLTTFYLSISGGGAVAGLFVGLVAPRIFDDYYELPLSVALGWILLLLACRGDCRSWIAGETSRWRWFTAVGATAAGLIAGAALFHTTGFKDGIHRERTFFGVLTVREVESPPQRLLMHGTTLHGVQSLDKRYGNAPTSYYGTRTPIGVLMRNRAKGEDTRVGLVGMGIGTLAAYGRPGDLFRFYEIDPAVVRIALDPAYFDVVSNSRAKIEIVEEDGRLALESELRRGDGPRFDILILDAFNSDSVPLHLLTREALNTYRAALAPDGTLAFHISNRYFRLGQPIARAAASAGMNHVFTQNDNFPAELSVVSQWIFASPSPTRIRSLLQQFNEEKLRPVPEGTNSLMVQAVSGEAMPGIPLWTDDHTNLLSALVPPEPLAGLKAFFEKAPSAGDQAPVAPR